TPGQPRLLTWCTSPQGTPSAAWWLRMASSSGPSSRQYTFPSGLWYSSIWRTPNWSALALRVSSAICSIASAGSFRSSWKAMNRGISRSLSLVSGIARGSRRCQRRRLLAARFVSLELSGRHDGEAPLPKMVCDDGAGSGDERRSDRDQGDLPAWHAAHDDGAR